MKESLRRALELMGYVLHRWPANRFDGMKGALCLLRRAGYSPRVIIDGGANMGAWTQMTRAIFPGATFHMIEPQQACRQALEDLARRSDRVFYHPVALTEPGVARVRLIGGQSGGTGAWVARTDERAADEVECPATTLDALLVDRMIREDRGLLKLDLEGHESPALHGGSRLLGALEVVVVEVRFFCPDSRPRPLFADIMSSLDGYGFGLYDITGLSSRPRDLRLRMADLIFVRRDSLLLADRSWE